MWNVYKSSALSREMKYTGGTETNDSSTITDSGKEILGEDKAEPIRDS